MMAVIWGRVWPYLAAVGGVVLAIITFGWSQRSAGRAEVRAESTTKTLESIDAQRAAAAAAPADRAGVSQRLRDGKF